MKKKILVMAMCVVMTFTAFAITGCGEEPGAEYIGQWTATSETWGDFGIAIEEDGSADFDALGMCSPGTWQANDDGTITLTTEDFEDIQLTQEDGQISFEFSGDKIVFDKVETE